MIGEALNSRRKDGVFMADYRNYNNQQPMYNPPQYQPQAGMEPPPGYPQKSRIAAGRVQMGVPSSGVQRLLHGSGYRGIKQL